MIRKKTQWFLIFVSAILLPVTSNILGIFHDIEDKVLIKFITGNFTKFGIPFDPRMQIFLSWVIGFSFLVFLVVGSVLFSKLEILQKVPKYIELIILGILSLTIAVFISGTTLLISML